jgi:hypothetical protein
MNSTNTTKVEIPSGRRMRSIAIARPHRLSAFVAQVQLSNSGVCKICTASSGVASQ